MTHTNEGPHHTAQPTEVDEPITLKPRDLALELTLVEANDPAWTERALCAQTDPESFFPEKGGSTRQAKKVCMSCTVQAECLDGALERDERFGIWGGLSERERRALTRRAARRSHTDPASGEAV